MSNELIKTDLGMMSYSSNDVNQAFTSFIEKVRNAVNLSTCKYKIKNKTKLEIPPYIDIKYIKISRNINNLHDKIRKLELNNLPTTYLKRKLIEQEEKLKNHTAIIVKRHYCELIYNNRIFSWKVINEITGKVKVDKRLLLCDNGNLVREEQNVADLFGAKFNATTNTDQSISSSFKYLGTPNENSIVLREVDEFDVSILIKSISIKKSVGSDGIPARVWKENEMIITTVLTMLINKIILEGVYPDVLKKAAVIPVHKGGDKLDINNYRGISLLPVINKIVEKVLYEQIAGFIIKYRQYDELQFGYRKYYGTQDALCILLSLVSNALDLKKFVTIVFFDVSKAFDSLNHQLLLHKISKMGIRGVALSIITQYLSNRYQFVKIGDQISKLEIIKCGVPQGSNLGPLLFNLMLYDLKYLDTDATIIKYADDIVMISVCEKISDIKESVKRDIEKILKRCQHV